ncbi:DUF7682 family zinc-binding protein [Cupriavidus sp. TMH.W2]|uniref:DUF7682 family zinc-binding protein n=1 Tax=Cupriavidus sp. TMH.W2 TaxID=3434465 RepID=UPI003D78A124
MKRRLECGHRGKGSYCHRCENEHRENERQVAREAATELQQRLAKKEKQAIKQAIRSVAEVDPIDLSALDHVVSLQAKARAIIQAILNGVCYRRFRGKRLLCAAHGDVISVPVGDHYRLLFGANPVRPLKLIHHETYNNLLHSDRLRSMHRHGTVSGR